MDSCGTVKEWKYWVLCWLLRGTEPGFPRWELDVTTIIPPIIAVLEIIAILYIPIWAESHKVWAPKLVVKMEEKTKQKEGGSGVGDTMKIAWNVEIVNDKKRSCGEVKNFQGSVRSMDVKPTELIVTLRGLRSSSSLRVVVIQAIDIFIRGCYL